MDIRLPKYTVEPIIRANAGEAKDYTYDLYAIDELHKKNLLGQGERVAILDTGYNEHHPDLIGTVDHVEDMTGLDNPKDSNYHSTWIHGRLAAQHNGIGVKGICPAAKIGIFKVLRDDGGGGVNDATNGVYRAVELGYGWIIMSLGVSVEVKAFKYACEYAASKGVIIFAASGNDGQSNGIDYPANWESTVSVGSHDSAGRKSSFSDNGPNLDLYDAGDTVLSTHGPDGYGYLTGTSMAAPTALAKAVCIRAEWERINNKSLSVHNMHELIKYIK